MADPGSSSYSTARRARSPPRYKSTPDSMPSLEPVQPHPTASASQRSTVAVPISLSHLGRIVKTPELRGIPCGIQLCRVACARARREQRVAPSPPAAPTCCPPLRRPIVPSLIICECDSERSRSASRFRPAAACGAKFPSTLLLAIQALSLPRSSIVALRIEKASWRSRLSACVRSRCPTSPAATRSAPRSSPGNRPRRDRPRRRTVPQRSF